MTEKRQSQLAGRATKHVPRPGVGLLSVPHYSEPRGGLPFPNGNKSGTKDPYELSDSSEDGHGERQLRRPAKKARLGDADHPDPSAGRHGAEQNPTKRQYPAPKLTNEPSNASSTVNLLPFSTIDDLDVAKPGSLAATVAKLDHFINESYLRHAQLNVSAPPQTAGGDGAHIKQGVKDWLHLPDSSRTLAQGEISVKQEQALDIDGSLPAYQESWTRSWTDHIPDDHQNTAVDFAEFVNIPEQDLQEESYSIGSLDEDDLAMLADTVAPPSHQTPPTSVLKEISSISSVGTYDPSLQRSSPGKAPKEPEEEELLDSDIDWSPILYQLATQANPNPLDQSASQLAAAAMPTHSQQPGHPPSHELVVQPISRPPFPQTLRGKSPICGLSNTTVLRTCFRLGHLIAENIHNSSRNQEAVYELYARVNYSHRNRPSSTQIPHFNVIQHHNSSRMQHFQFVDLWRDTKPYVWGVLENWRPDGVLDKQSSIFLSSGPPPSQFTQNNEQAQGEKKICRCICHISKAAKEESQSGGRNKRNNPEIGGWVMKVLWIEEVGWETILKMKTIVCGN